jgi:hypothetical protein
MARRKKRLDAIERHKEQRYAREYQAQPIDKVFPGVNGIRIDITFRDYDEKCHPEPKQLTYVPQSKAFFEIECPFYECVLGGFNFSIDVKKCVENKRSMIKGESICQGWQDEERIHRYRCRLKAEYTISVDYKKV